jgi:protoporphyrinogen oxidase
MMIYFIHYPSLNSWNLSLNSSVNNLSILGGGAAGMAMAYYSQKQKLPFALFESSGKVGGNCRTFTYQDYRFDSGAHRLHDQDLDTITSIQTLLADDLILINVPSQIYLQGSFIDFPLTPLNIFNFLGLKRSSLAIYQVLKQSLNSLPENNFYDLSLSRYGKLIAELFLLSYTEKLWGLPAHSLSPQVAGKRLKGLNLKSFILELGKGKQTNKNHLDGDFYYPNHGIGSIFDAMFNYSGENNFELNSPVVKIFHQQHKLVSMILKNGEEKNLHQVVSTLPLNFLFQALDPAPPEELLMLARTIRFRNVLLVGIFLNKTSVNANGSMYFPSDQYPFTRIYEPRNRSPAMSPPGKTSLIVEIPCQKDDEIWQEKEQSIISRTVKQLIDIGFFTLSEVDCHCVQRIQHAYPVMEKGFETKIQPLFDYLGQFSNLHIAGRNGLFAYTHIHDHMKNARKTIGKLMEG